MGVLLFKGLLSVFILLGMLNTTVANAEYPTPAPSLKYGAQTYKQRCVLCHGKQGYGDGTLALALRGVYPSANLHVEQQADDLDSVRRYIVRGGGDRDAPGYMPPWGDELTHVQLESVAMFVQHLRENRSDAVSLLASTEVPDPVSLKVGKKIYNNYCSLCHGQNGEGNGKMARIIKNPPPFNLTLSGVPSSYVKDMVRKGGEAMGRSPRMPPFEDQVSDTALDSLVLYVMSLRKYQQ